MTREAAVAAARRGWSVFPCRPGDKRPAVQDWERRACPDPETVAAHWPSERHNIGIACGPSNLVVLDLDAHGGLPDDWQLPGVSDGKDVLTQICEWAGMPWPSTYTVATPSNGWHLYFTAPDSSRVRNSASLIGPQVDVRANGGYVIAAGSAVGGKTYEVLDDGSPRRCRGGFTGSSSHGPSVLTPLARPPRPACPASALRDSSARSGHRSRETGRARSCGPRSGWPR